MAVTTPVALDTALTTANLTLYTAFATTSPVQRAAMLVSVDLTNTTGAAITVDLWKRNAGDTISRLFADDLSVASKKTCSWRGIIPLLTGETLHAQASAVGVDCLGAVMEST